MKKNAQNNNLDSHSVTNEDNMAKNIYLPDWIRVANEYEESIIKHYENDS